MLKKLLKQYVIWTYGVFYCFILLIGMAMLVLKWNALAGVLQVISAWTATFVFIAMFHKIYPEDSLKQFIAGQFREKIKLSSVIWMILLQTVLFLGCILTTSIFRNISITSIFVTSWITWLVTFLDNLIRGPLGEELGWRGFVLNELQKKCSPLKSAMIVGVVWAFWHTPLWFLSGYAGIQLLIYIISFLVYIISASVIMTVFYHRNHNLFIPIIGHQLCNYFLAMQTGDVLQNLMVTAVAYLIVAIVLVFVSSDEMRTSALRDDETLTSI